MDNEERIEGDFPSPDTGQLVRPGGFGVVDIWRATASIDPQLAAHEMRTARLGGLLAEQIGLTRGHVLTACAAGLAHDIGKLSPELAGLTALDCGLKPAERAKMAVHGELGARILSLLGLSGPVPDVVRLHHKPQSDAARFGVAHSDTAHFALPGDLQMKAALDAVVVADVFDALTSIRGYRDPCPLPEAMNYLSDRGRFDQGVVAALRDLCIVRGFDPERSQLVGVDELTGSQGWTAGSNLGRGDVREVLSSSVKRAGTAFSLAS